MKRHSDEVVRRIRRVRNSEKSSFAKLGKRFNLPPSTIRNWCSDLKISKSDVLTTTNRKRRKAIRDSDISVVPQEASKDKNLAKFLAAILYGCEGGKYPAQSGVAFVNSDPKLILAFLNLLRKSFNLDNSKFSIHLQIHTTHNFEKLTCFWSKILDLPKSCFIKPTITVPRGGKHRRKYWGTCSLRYRDYKIQLKLLGIYEKFIEVFLEGAKIDL